MSSSSYFLQVLDDPAKTRKLKIEIATTVDAMEPFKATYKLEGDVPLSLEAYQQLSIIFASVSTQHYPNVAAVVKAEANGNASHELQLLDYCMCTACIQLFLLNLTMILSLFWIPFLSSKETIDGINLQLYLEK